jgi:4-amino-4-deoxy-L-arabinose transferase-like glycosyltransferase
LSVDHKLPPSRVGVAAEDIERRRFGRLLLGAGLGLGLASIVLYAASGYDWTVLLLWLAGLAAMGAYFFERSAPWPTVARWDLFAPAGLLVLFAPLYLIHLYGWPVQVITDEPTIMQVSADESAKHDVDPFGVSFYQVRPVFLFVVWGKLGHLIGGIDLFHMRLLSALVGLLVIAASYALFRQLLPLGWAFFASCVLGVSHSLLIISRLAMRENTAVLAEILALALLLWGLRHDQAFVTYLGGIAAGLGFFVYHPGRAALPIWILFLIALALLFRHRFAVRRLAVLGAIAFAGFALTATPLMIAEAKAPSVGPEVEPRNQLLFTRGGLELQKDWVYADSIWEGYRKNVTNGLAAFNSHKTDNGYIYINPGHGFLDPLSGILVWAGVAAVGFALVRRRKQEDPWSLLMLIGFLALWLAFAFLINEAPKYSRMLIALPFVAYLVTAAVRTAAALLARALRRFGPVRAGRAGVALAAAALVLIAASNLAVAWDYIDSGRKNGELVGSTGRYVAAHPNEGLYLISDRTEGNHTYTYYEWGKPVWWVGWTKRFKPNSGLRGVVRSGQVESFQATAPFGFLMTDRYWHERGSMLRRMYPQGDMQRVTPDGQYLAFVVPRA